MSKSWCSTRTQQWKDTTIPRRPLLWLAAALLFTLPRCLAILRAGSHGSFFSRWR